ncbi:sugar-binding protein [Pseudomonas sp. WHRI 8519]|uniref:sugar-binding protein n=1 Tax=Pseudomonas sp. WHRI 8519 TaxID=3162567 RepID=UPI0032EF799A
MTTKTLVHSNAFNFLSFVQNSVDPRTGQYTLAIELPELVGNDLSGPSLPLRLAYNPLNNQDSGFGVGWTLNLTEYVPASNMLTLHTGERYKVVGDSNDYAIPERKLESFHFHVDDAEHFRVVHKTGLVEFLELHGPQSNRVALPVRVEAASGHAITLEHTQNPYAENAPCLNQITQAGPPLLTLTYESARVLIDLHPGAGPGGAPLARYELKLSSQGSPARRCIDAVVLPTDDKASWRFDYREQRGLFLLSEVATPSGAVETIAYDDDGHTFPGGGQLPDPLPRVTRHQIDPGADQPPMITTYDYTSNNFLGYGSGIQWKDDGEDHLYDSTDQYFTYGSTATQWVLDAEGVEQPLRTITRTFNRFHLLSKQVTNQDEHIQEAETAYHELPGLTFARQPNNFQLPYSTTQRWKRGNQLREEVLITRYDEHGNLTLKSEVAVPRYDAQGKLLEAPTLAGTIYIRHSYYPALGEGDDCPPDPYGFVRTTKEETRYPATDAEGQAQTLSNRYYYRTFDTLGGSQGADHYLLERQAQLQVHEGNATLTIQAKESLYFDDAADALRHGRLECETTTRAESGLPSEVSYITQVAYTYEKLTGDAGNVLQTVQTHTGFDHDEELEDGSRRDARKTVTLQHCVLINEPLLNLDDNQVEIAYQYDPLRRVIQETVSPNDPQYTASRTYTYTLVGATGGRASQTMADVKHVITRSWVDGLNRVVEEERQDADADTPAKAQDYRIKYQARYDALGDLVEEVEYDWLDYSDRKTELPLPSHYLYDAWGERYCEIGADGAKHYDQLDPIGDASADGPLRDAWSESADGTLKTGVTRTWLDLAQQPTRIERFDAGGNSYSVEQHFYDGLRRKCREIDAAQASKRFTYDEFDRLRDETLANGAVVRRDYAPHSGEDLPVAIDVDGVVLGTQRFDGLDRMIESTTGGRRRVQHFAPGQRQPEAVVTAAGAQIKYRYAPQLGEEPLERYVETTEVRAQYDYDGQNARLTKCNEQGEGLERDYFSTGQLKYEKRQVGDQPPFEMHYRASLQGRELEYTDVLGQVQTYQYDQHGRLASTTLGTLSSTFEYDPLGRLEVYETRDGEQYLKTTLEYDEFGREIHRTFDMGEHEQTLSQEYYPTDQLRDKYLLAGETELRHEHYEYDARGRLTKYTCTAEDGYAPVDPYGKVIREQVFGFDNLDNITRVRTIFPEGQNMATYVFDLPDPVQLHWVRNNHGDYPEEVELLYDADGNMTRDEEGRNLTYDPLGRLVSVVMPSAGVEAAYGYDPLDRLVSQSS